MAQTCDQMTMARTIFSRPMVSRSTPSEPASPNPRPMPAATATRIQIATLSVNPPSAIAPGIRIAASARQGRGGKRPASAAKADPTSAETT
jgi:hypothetical protein